jgi:hypothetical protein
MAKWTEAQKLAAREAYKARVANISIEEMKEIVKEEVPIVTPKVREVVVSEPEYVKPMGMEYEHKIQSMSNAIKILPPNMIKDGRHLKENVQAICGFMVLDEMMDEVYKDYVHPEYP